MRSDPEVRDWVENELTLQLMAIHGVSGGGMVREVEEERMRSYGL